MSCLNAVTMFRQCSTHVFFTYDTMRRWSVLTTKIKVATRIVFRRRFLSIEDNNKIEASLSPQ